MTDRSPFEWNTPHSEPPETPPYHPRTLRWLVRDVGHVLRKWFWHKRQSLYANRTSVTFDALLALQKLDSIQRDEDVPRHRREDAEQAKRLIRQVCSEMNIEDDRLDRYRD